MRALFGSIRGRAVLVALGVVCLCLLVWFAAPYVGLQSAVARLLTIMAIIVAWTLVLLVRQLREARANAMLTEGAPDKASNARAARAGEAGRAVSADARALRDCFAEAAEFLRRSGSSRTSLYELPWYAIIGPPGTGKTTLIEKSGLKFPVSQRIGARKVTGVGGTRNCQWWFTDEAILLDTAGRFTTQNSNAAVDRDGWLEFLALLRRYRRRQPLNGLFVAFSAADLAAKSAEDLESAALVIRERLEEIYTALRISLPVYFMVTQCDLISGFTEFFDDLDTDARKQVLGFTFDLDQSRGRTAADQVGPLFKELADRLASRLMSNLNTERDPARRVALMAFPAQFASLQGRLEAFVNDVFAAGRFDRGLLLRGVYFTSGTQVGAPIDRMMAAVAKEFGFSNQETDRRTPSGRAFFIERLLRGVIFPESGLAGTDRRLEIRKAAAQFATYIACLALAGLSIVWLTVSFAKNASYLQDVREALNKLQANPDAISQTASMDQVLPRLDSLKAVVDVADRQGARAPWSMRFFLYQPSGMAADARAAYVRVVNASLTPVLSSQLRDRLIRVAGEPENLFESLKAYLLLDDTSHFEHNREDLANIANLEWTARYGRDPSVPTRLASHLNALLDSKQALAAPPSDRDTVARARASLAGLTPQRLVYARIARVYSANPAQGFRLNIEAGLDSDKVLVRRSGRPLSDPLPYLYTRPAFQEISTLGAVKASASFLADGWVFGPQSQSLANQARLPFDVISVYEDDYILKWDALLADIGLKPVTRAADVTNTLRILSEPDSPLRNLVKKVEDNTNLVKPADDSAKSASPLAQLESGGSGLVGKGLAAAQAQLGGGTVPPGTRITDHFRPVFNAGPAIDKCLSALGQIALQLNAAGAGFVNAPAAGALSQGGSVDLARGLDLCAAALPAPLNGIVKQASAASQSAAIAQIGGQLSDRVAQLVTQDCKEVTATGYPFRNTPVDEVPLADFGRVFGFGGTFDTFFRDSLASLVDARDNGWRWREVNDAQITAAPGVLPSFERAKKVRDAFFDQGGQTPHVAFTLTAESLDADVVHFALEIDGQKFDDKHDPKQAVRLIWPGPSPGLVTFRFEDRNGVGPSIKAQGKWAWFRILDGAQLERLSATRYLVTLRAGDKKEQLMLEAESIHNPFDRNLLEHFRCPT